MEVLHFPHFMLRRIASSVLEIDDELRVQAEAMSDIMQKSGGIGLAGPQVGIPRRIIVLALGDLDQVTTLINPRISSLSEEKVSSLEGCLSFPGLQVKVMRSQAVVVSALDLDGSESCRRLKGLEAICLQHEMDHLDGRLIIDYLSPLKKDMLVRKLRKVRKAAR